jgi:phosphoglycolate phosphatase
MSDYLRQLVASGRIRGVAFDLDGTLLDTLPDIADAGNAMLAELGRPVVDEAVVRSYIGDGIPKLVKRLLTGTREAEPEAQLFEGATRIFQARYFERLDARTRAYPGAVDGIGRLRRAGFKLAVVTNKAERFARPLLDAHFGAGAFDLVLGGDSLAKKKPDPMPILHCCEHFGIVPAGLLVVGDSANDVAAGLAAGCPVVCVPYGYTGGLDVRSLGADAIVPDILSVAVGLHPE